MVRCKHKWVDLKDGTRDKFCSKCGKKAKQAVAYLPLGANSTSRPTQPLMHPAQRETIMVNTGKLNLGKVEVYKDDILEAISKQLSIRLSI